MLQSTKNGDQNILIQQHTQQSDSIQAITKHKIKTIVFGKSVVYYLLGRTSSRLSQCVN